MSEVVFQCSSCTLCCKKVGNHVKAARMKLAMGKVKDALTRAVAAFPFKFDKTGTCVNLGIDGKCKVYETRPDICNVASSYNYIEDDITIEQWFEINAKVCNGWIREAKLPASFLIKEKY